MTTLRTGSFYVPLLTPSGNTVNTFLVLLTNQTYRVQNVRFSIDQFTSTDPIIPNNSITVLKAHSLT